MYVLTHVHVYLCLLQQSNVYYVTSSFSPFSALNVLVVMIKLVLLPQCRMMSVCRKVLFALQL
jgi:hypothetical protein